MNLQKIFTNQSMWTQGADCRLSDGTVVPVDYISQDKKTGINIGKVKSWSLQGALSYYFSYDTNQNSRYKMLDKLRAAILKYTGKPIPLAQFNDHKNTEFKDIQNIIKLVYGQKISERKRYE